MPSPPIPPDECSRVASLRNLALLDTPPEESFERIARLARDRFHVPIALISLVDEDRQWFKTSLGLGLRETPREIAFCAHTILSDAPMVVADAALDPRFAANPMVTGSPGIRFYAGAPLSLDDGYRIGTLCVADTHLRPDFDSRCAAELADFAALVNGELRLRDTLRRVSAAEDALRLREAEYRGVFLNSLCGIFRATPGGRLILANPVVLRMLGYASMEELAARGVDLENLTHGEDPFLRLLERDGRTDNYETTWRRKDGSLVPVRQSTCVTYSAAGQPLHYDGVVEDMSERHAAKARERDAASLLENIVNTVPCVVYVLDVQTNRCLYVNFYVATCLGYTPEEIRNAPDAVAFVIHPGDVEAVAAHQSSLASLADGESREIEYRVRHRNGEWKWMMGRDAIFQRGPSGEATQVLGTSSDITRIRSMEKDLALKEERWQLAIEANNDGLFDLDLETGRVFQSPRCAEILGTDPSTTVWSVEEAARRIHASHLAHVRGELETYLQRESPSCRIEFLVSSPAGERWVAIRVIAQWRPDGTAFRLVGSVRDIDIRKQAEIALRQQAELLREARDRAQAATNAKSAFLATMSHEIRTPMNAVVGMANLLAGTALSAEQREFVETIQASSESLLALIEQILEFSDLEAGRLELASAEFDLHALVEETAEFATGAQPENRLPFFVSIGPGVPGVVRGDARRLRQVLVNLLGNAVKFTAAGYVLLEVKSLDAPDGAARFIFSISDTGPGVPPSAQARIFESFTQADSSISRRFGGSGLGLAVSKKLVELMGGRMGLESAPDAGSRFWFEIPLDPAPAPARAAPSLPAGSVALVLDPHSICGPILEEHLRSFQCPCIAVTDAGAALEILSNPAPGAPRPNFAIAGSLSVPEVEEFIRSVHALPGLAGFPVLLSADSPLRSQPEGISPASGALTSPLRRNNLYRAICLALESRTPAARAAAPASIASAVAPPADSPVSEISAAPRLLLAEDNIVNQRVATLILRKLGYCVDVAGNGLEAIEAWRAWAHPLILMDCQMPELDGLEATRRIRRIEGSVRKTVIIALTANALAEDRESCLVAGMDDYLAKPVRPEALQRKIADWLATVGAVPA